MCGIGEFDRRTLRTRTVRGMVFFLLCAGFVQAASGHPALQQTGAEVRTVAGAAVSTAAAPAVHSDTPRKPSSDEQEASPEESTEAPPPVPSPPNKEEGKKSGPDPNAYIIGEQDSLAITVWKEKEISGGVVVRPDGKITVPLAGEIMVVGMTPVQLQDVLAEKLKPFVTVPQVTVAVTDIRSRKVYLIGKAVREGTFTINSSTTVLQIIAQVGGLKDFAKRKKIYILRQHGNEQLRFPFNFDDVIRGRHTEQNILLEPGDTIVVP